MFGSTKLLEAAALIGLGIIIESPEKRKIVIGTLDKAGINVEKAVKSFFQSKGGNVVNAKPETDEQEFI